LRGRARNAHLQRAVIFSAGITPSPFCRLTSIGSSNNSYIRSPNGTNLIPSSHGAPFSYSTTNVRFGIQFTQNPHPYGGAINSTARIWAPSKNEQGNNSVFDMRGLRSEALARGYISGAGWTGDA
jgi:hypothetical protein